MSCDSSSRGYLLADASVPERLHLETEELLEHFDVQDRKRDRERGEKLARLAAESRQRLEKLLGPDTFRDYRQLIVQTRLELQDKLEPPSGPDLKEEEIERWKETRFSEFARERGVAVDRVRELQETFAVKFAELTHTEAQSTVVPEREVPEEIRAHRTNPWTLFVPPYAGGRWGSDWVENGYGVAFHRSLDTASGLVGNRVRLTNRSAGDEDYALARYDTQIFVWYETGEAGLIEAWVEAQNGEGHHSLTLEDEIGWSSSRTRQDNFIMMHPIHANVQGVSLARMSWFRVRGVPDDRTHYSRRYLRRGSTYWAHLFSDGPVPANTRLAIRCGTRSVTSSATNDVEVFSRTDFRWFIRSLQVRTTGG